MKQAFSDIYKAKIRYFNFCGTICRTDLMENENLIKLSTNKAKF